ncbi:MAG: DinB family protein [Armatimonadetes bacterium]|nr:DinB family protein [Armatimonadota bacterium]
MQTTQGIDARAYLSGFTQAVTGMYCADINAIPEDKWTTAMGGCTRPASELTADALSLLSWVTNVLNGGEPGEMNQDNDACATKAGSIAAVQKGMENFNTALAGASDELLNTTVTAPFGMEMPVFAIAQIAVSHVWYHDGQLNYIQSLLGDDKVHWMGD